MGRSYMNWSGGKDSALCLNKIKQRNDDDVDLLLTSINTVYDRISMHGVRRKLLEMQANSVGMRLETIELAEMPSMEDYNQELSKKINCLKQQGYDRAFFGDIFLEDLRKYRENQLSICDITCEFPLWQIPTATLINEFIDSGFKAVVVCVNEQLLDRSFCGRIIDESFIKEFPSTADVCGENGEYHSFVFDGPIFRNPIPFVKGETIYRRYPAPALISDSEAEYGFYFCDLLPVNDIAG